MILTVLGSGASEGIPAFLCQCATCITARRRRGKEVRQNSFALLQARTGEQLLIDVPPHFKASWDTKRLREDRLCAVLVTHRHDDHSLGIPYLWDAVIHSSCREAQPLPIYMPADVYDLRVRPFEQGTADSSGRGKPVRAMTARAGQQVRAGPFRITPLETNHLGADDPLPPGAHLREDFGYLVEDDDGTRLAYMVDAPAVLPAATMKALSARRLDCLVYECTFARCEPARGHCDVPGLRAVAARLAPRMMIATHVGHGNQSHRLLQRELRPEGIRVAFDGMRVRIPA